MHDYHTQDYQKVTVRFLLVNNITVERDKAIITYMCGEKLINRLVQ